MVRRDRAGHGPHAGQRPALDALEAQWRARLEPHADHLFSWLLQEPESTTLELLAFVAASTILAGDNMEQKVDRGRAFAHLAGVDNAVATCGTAFGVDHIKSLRRIMRDEAGGDDKLLCVPAGDVRWDHIQDITDVSEFELGPISHFFEHYKDLEPNKWVKGEGWSGKDEAERLVREAQERFEASHYDSAAEAEQN